MSIKSTHKKALWLACLGTCLPFSVVHALPQYAVIDLGSIGGAYSVGLGVNNSGLVSGFSHLPANSSEHAIIGRSLTLPQDLDTLGGIHSQAYGINNLDMLVGSATLLGDGSYHAFRLSPGAVPPLAQLQDLKALTASGNSRAFSLNDSGQASGFSSTAVSGVEHAVIWQADGVTITDLGTLNPLNAGNSQGLAINATGQVVGFSSLNGQKAPRAVLWANGNKTDLGTLGGTYSAAYGINALGEVVGSATTSQEATQHAFLWQPTPVLAMKDLGTLGGTFSEARGISSNGEVVGYSFTLANAAQKAFLWQSGLGLQDLNSLKDPVTGAGWQLLDAQAISEDGRYITGVGILTTTDVATGAVLGKGDRHAFLLKSLSADATPPKISFALTPAAPGVTGWYLTPPSLAWTVTDVESAITSKVGCVDTLVSNTSLAGLSFSCGASSTGGTAPAVNTPVLKVDNQAPTLTVSGPITQASTSPAGAVVSFTPTAVDTFSGIRAAGVSCLPASGTTFAIGATTVNCSVMDVAGNSASASFSVTVADQTPPLVTANLTGTAGLNGWFTSAVSVAWSVTDAESAVTSAVCAPATIATSGTGQIRTCVATSGGGTVTVNTPLINIDTVVPVFTSCPATVALTQGQALLTPAATDNLSTPVVTGNAPTSLAIGTTAVTWNASDSAGLSASCQQQVTVKAADQTPPLVTANLTGTAGLNGWFTSAVSVAWSVTDAESAVTSAVCAPATIATSGTGQIRTCVATSSGGTVTVNTPLINIDTVAPVFTSCPATVALTQGQALLTPAAIDNLSMPVVKGNAPASLAIGTTAVTWKASDTAGLSSSCLQQVTVKAAISETVAVTLAQCKRLTATTGQWSVAGSSTNSTSNTIQLYLTAAVPATPFTASTLGSAVPVVKGKWLFQPKTGPACTTPISLRSSAAGTVRGNVLVTIQ